MSDYRQISIFYYLGLLSVILPPAASQTLSDKWRNAILSWWIRIPHYRALYSNSFFCNFLMKWLSEVLKTDYIEPGITKYSHTSCTSFILLMKWLTECVKTDCIEFPCLIQHRFKVNVYRVL